MEPLSPDDPVFKLLGKAKVVEPRPNFTQNVMRAIRQESQEVVTLWSRLALWGQQLLSARTAWVTSAVVAGLAVLLAVRPSEELHHASAEVQVAVGDAEAAAGLSESVSIEVEDAASVATTLASEFQNMDQLSLLLAQQDTSALTDSEIALLLY